MTTSQLYHDLFYSDDFRKRKQSAEEIHERNLPHCHTSTILLANNKLMNLACLIFKKHYHGFYIFSNCEWQWSNTALIARFMGPTWGPSWANRTQVGPMLAPWTLISGCLLWVTVHGESIAIHIQQDQTYNRLHNLSHILYINTRQMTHLGL